LNPQAWVEIDLRAVAHNVRAIKSLIGERVRLCAVVKDDGYGHGALPVARVARAAGADFFAVSAIADGARLRRAGFGESILVLGYTAPERAREIVELGLTATVFSLEGARALSAAALDLGATAKAHLKIDTGMNRLGISPEEAPSIAAAMAELPSLELEGVYSHFVDADSTDLGFARKQLALFLAAVDAIEARGVKVAIRHIANSTGTVALPEARLDMVRPGIALYGLKPSSATDMRDLPLRPAMRLVARVAMVKDIPAGASVSYGRTFIAARASRIATLPIGFALGLPRELSNRGSVLIAGKRAPVVGRICMDLCMIDVTDVPGVGVGDEATFFAASGLTADEVADSLGTVNCELVCILGKCLPRRYLRA
jgi:alanine racemase